jgi:radical SAM superfamily enzyme YgiQ (UPF0313 family)
MKIMIAYPPLDATKGVPLLSQNRQFQYFTNPSYIYPLVPASAATLLKSKGYEVYYKDAIVEGLSSDEFYDYVVEVKPDVIAMETKTPVIKEHWEIIDKLKQISKSWGMSTVLMGDHVTAFPEESMTRSKVDFVITGGDYDFMLLAVCQYMEKGKEIKEGIWYRAEGKVKNTGEALLDNDLNELPIIDRELTNAGLYNIEYNIRERPFAYTMVGRDCPYGKCRFCSWTTLFPKFRTRDPESLLDEIGMLIDKYGVKAIFDDTGTFPTGAWLETFCEGMVSRGYNKIISFSCNMRVDYLTEKNAQLMKKANFRLLKIGLESANQDTLDRVNKGIKVEQITEACRIARKAGLQIHLTIMVGYPWETRKDAERTYALAKSLMVKGLAELLQSTIVVSYPGTPLFKEVLDNNWLLVSPDDYEAFDMARPILRTVEMSPEEIMEMCDRVYSIFMSPGYIFRKILSIRSLEDIKYYFRGAKAVFGHKKDFSRTA